MKSALGLLMNLRTVEKRKKKRTWEGWEWEGMEEESSQYRTAFSSWCHKTQDPNINSR